MTFAEWKNKWRHKLLESQLEPNPLFSLFGWTVYLDRYKYPKPFNLIRMGNGFRLKWRTVRLYISSAGR